MSSCWMKWYELATIFLIYTENHPVSVCHHLDIIATLARFYK